MPALNLFNRSSDKPRLSIRERFRNAAARVMPRSRKSRAGSVDTSRRAVVAGCIASIAVAPIGALAAPGADAELLRLGRAHDATFERVSDLNRRVATSGAADLPNDDELDEICAASTDLEFAIHRIPAKTWAGVVVKARIAAEYVPPAKPGEPLLDDILANLIDDILRIAGAEPKRHTSLH